MWNRKRISDAALTIVALSLLITATYMWLMELTR